MNCVQLVLSSRTVHNNERMSMSISSSSVVNIIVRRELIATDKMGERKNKREGRMVINVNGIVSIIPSLMHA